MESIQIWPHTGAGIIERVSLMRTLRVVAAAVVIAAFSAVGATSAQAEVKTPISAAGWQWSASGWQW